MRTALTAVTCSAVAVWRVCVHVSPVMMALAARPPPLACRRVMVALCLMACASATAQAPEDRKAEAEHAAAHEAAAQKALTDSLTDALAMCAPAGYYYFIPYRLPNPSVLPSLVWQVAPRLCAGQGGGGGGRGSDGD